MIFARVKRILLGEPLTNQMAVPDRLPKWKALAVLSPDALSSVAYATGEVLIPLAAFGAAAVSWSLPIALAIAALLGIVTVSYRQTIQSYPQGGGAYTVAKENLGASAGLVAGASLLIDYVLTVAVSIAAGVENLAAALPGLGPHKEGVGALLVLLVTFMNLRGLNVRASATAFALPTYVFVLSFAVMLAKGGLDLATGATTAAAPVLQEAYPAVPMLFLLRSFSSGCSALTGVEAISNATPAFEQPSQRNAKATLVWMAVILGGIFLGLTTLSQMHGLVPREGQTPVSLLARAVFGDGWAFYLMQGSTALILVLAANASYAAFPRLSSLLAKDRYMPRQLASVGDRLVFSNGILGLSVAAMSLIVVFEGNTHRLIPLYAVGVFLSLSLSQLGMVAHHLRERGRCWRRALAFNAFGALTTTGALAVIATTKFAHGAWAVLLMIPALVLVFSRIHDHYMAVGRELSLMGQIPPGALKPIKHTVIVPISGIHRGVIDALRYALSISEDVRACYVEIDSGTTERMKAEWQKWAHEVPFVVLKSPYRSVIRPLLEYVDDVEQTTHGDVITVIIPEFVTSRWRYQILHNQTALMIRAALLFKRGKVVTSVRYHLRDT